MRRIKAILIATVGAWSALSQSQEPQGGYHFQLLQVQLEANRVVSENRTVAGTIEFNGDGSFTYQGESGTIIPAGGGAFVVTNPATPSATLNVRLAAGDELLLAASTESTGLLGMLVAVKAPAERPPVSGTYRGAALDLLPASVPVAQTTFGTLDTSQATVNISADGRGTISDPLFGELQVFVAAGGNFIVGHPANGDGLFLATRTGNAELPAMYWLAELAVDRESVTCSIGSLLPHAGGGGRISQRSNTVRGSRDFRGTGALTLNPDGAGSLEATPIATGTSNTLVGASATSILFAVEAPNFAGPDPFLHPHGVVDAASLAPVTNPVAPGSFVSLYGSGFEGTDPEATTVNVNGLPASVIFVSPGQINVRLSPEVSGASARFVVDRDGQSSNTVRVPLAMTSPALFSVDFSGVGAGMVTHADFSLVSAASPARRGEIVLLWGTGLGVSQPQPRIMVGGSPAQVLFSGEHPEFPGLYQLNVQLPANAPLRGNVPLTLLTSEGVSDTVEIAVAP